MSEVSKLRDDDVDRAPAEAETVPEAGPEDDAATARGSRAGARKFRLKRHLLMVVVPLLLVAAAIYAYLHAGRYVSTENAYVKAHIVNVAAEVSAAIAEVLVEENQRVVAGQPLLRLRAQPFQIDLARAEAALARAETEVTSDKQAYARALAEISLHEATAAFARTQLERQQRLRAADLGTLEALDTARYALDSALQQVEVDRQQAATLLARLNGDPEAPVTAHPAYREALASVEQAKLDLQRTVLEAPFDGVVKNRPEPGDYVERGVAILSVVSDADMWIDANFKETQLTYIEPGQTVSVEIDAYPGRRWTGRVESISEATGAEFALLPPQNATGNWVKIVQRIPVRVVVENADGMPPLRAGMSSTVTVDTGHARSWRDLVPGV